MQKPHVKQERIMIRVTPALKKRIEAAAERHYVRPPELIRKVVEDWLRSDDVDAMLNAVSTQKEASA